ncbi:MAG: MFS transporter [Candidatus Limnocylindrales bacterium]
MLQQARIVATVARDSTLARIELAFLGFNMAEYATWIAILVYGYGEGGSGFAALIAVAQLVPAGLVAPLIAGLADRFRRDRVLFAGYLWQAGSFGATAAALYLDAPIALTIVAAAVAATSVTITRPVQAVILPSISHSPAHLTAANAVSGLAENSGIFLGPLLAGLLLARSEPGDVFAVFAVVSLVNAVLVSRLPPSYPPGRVDDRTRTWRDGLAETFGGFGALRREPRALLLVTILTAVMIVFGALDLLFVAVAIDLLGLGESWAGYLNAAFGLGGVAGAVATVALVGRRRMTPAIAGGGALYGLPISMIAVAPSPVIASGLLAGAGVGFSIVNVAGRTLLQRVAPEALLGRVFGVLEGLSMFALAVGAVLAGTLIAAFEVSGALFVVGCFVPIAVALAWRGLAAIDRDARPVDVEALELLRRLPIFAPLSALAIDRILIDLVRLEVPAGEVVIREGDAADRFYVIVEGRVEISVAGTAVSSQEAGDHFGEIALLRSVPRTATVTALTPLRLIAIGRELFLEAVTGHPLSQINADSVADERMAAAHH